MKPETEGKALVVLIISLIAFGCGSGAGIVMGISQNETPNITQVNKTNQEMPQIPTTKNVNIQTQPQTTSNPNNTNEEIYIDNKPKSTPQPKNDTTNTTPKITSNN